MYPQSYWCENGKYEKTYQHFYDKLVPSRGNADTPDGELLRIISKIYYRYYNDGDSYYCCVEEYGWDITKIKGINNKLTREVDFYLGMDTEADYERAVNLVMEYIMFNYSTKEKIWNPYSLKLVKIHTSTGFNLIKKLNYNITYTSIKDKQEHLDQQTLEQIINNSTKEKIWNPRTNRLVKLESIIGFEILKQWGFNITYSPKIL